jgi:hypothetical protein
MTKNKGKEDLPQPKSQSSRNPGKRKNYKFILQKKPNPAISHKQLPVFLDGRLLLVQQSFMHASTLRSCFHQNHLKGKNGKLQGWVSISASMIRKISYNWKL